MEKPWEKVIWPRPKTGDEKIAGTGKTLLDYWRWADSDLVSNASRGVVAEFLVAKAVGDLSQVRDPWAVYDLKMPAGHGHPEIKIEVKSGAYIQSWKQFGYSKIHFGGLKSRAWHLETNQWDPKPAYHADVYVFAIHKCKDPDRLDPLDTAQWYFRVLSRRTIEKYGAKSLSLRTVRRLEPVEREQAMLIQMKTLADVGSGPTAIAKALNADGLVNPRTGRRWTPGNVGALLKTASRRETA